MHFILRTDKILVHVNLLISWRIIKHPILQRDIIMKVTVNKVSSSTEIQQCFDVRLKVFVEGQNVPLNEEVDGKDKDSEHYLLTVNHLPAGVARVRIIDDYAKIERVGILDEFQGKGFGKQVMDVILLDLNMRSNLSAAKLSSQTHAIPFYEKLGFIVCSDEYMDAGIPHKDMILNLPR